MNWTGWGGGGTWHLMNASGVSTPPQTYLIILFHYLTIFTLKETDSHLTDTGSKSQSVHSLLYVVESDYELE